MDEELENILARLWQNWTFRLSLSSNELFHSNVLQYIAEYMADGGPEPGPYQAEGAGEVIENLPSVITVDAARLLLELLGGDQPNHFAATREQLNACDDTCTLTVRREWEKIDLAVLLQIGAGTPHPLFALEVKVKAYPDIVQLQRHRQKLGDITPLFLLTGMGGEVADDIPEVKVLSFDCLANRLETIALEPVLPAYTYLCRDLHQLFIELNDKLNQNLTWQRAFAIGRLLETYRLHPIWWKLWASHVAENCRVACALGNIDAAVNLHFYSDFKHGVGNLGACWKWSDERNGVSINLGVQIEGSSLRLFLEIVHPQLGSKADVRRKVESVLLKLCLRVGLFANNQPFQDAIGRWRERNRPQSPYTHIGLLNGEYDVQPQPPFPDSGLFEGNVVIGRPRGAFRPMLAGYANAENNGFADIRLTIRNTATLNEVVEFVKDVLIRDHFSAPPANIDAGPLLFQIVQSFGNATSKIDWINDPPARDAL